MKESTNRNKPWPKPTRPLPAIFDPIKGKSLARKRLIINNIPEVLNAKTMLYIGANPNRMELIDLFYGMGIIIDVVEAWEENFNGLCKLNEKWMIFRRIYRADIREEIYCSYFDKYDVVCWHHGPEHIPKEQVPRTLEILEGFALQYVILGMPWGLFPQGPKEGNIHEVHHWAAGKKFFENLGYETQSIKKKNKRGSHILAWKKIKK